jgi:hypothetical protein
MSIEAESSLLGCLLRDNGAYDRISALMNARIADRWKYAGLRRRNLLTPFVTISEASCLTPISSTLFHPLRRVFSFST